ncbi:kinase-like domain-containing protein, partial [Gigaspora rosea]
GISRDPQSKNYIAVIEYASHGSLINYLSKNIKTLTWDKRLTILSDIIQGLKNIHEGNSVHKDLHAGNILIHNTENKDYTAISDLGLCHFVSRGLRLQNPNVVYGVIPYIAPEVLQGRPYTKAADIYSTGVLMWVISSGKQPFEDRGHDFQLQIDICNGMRPEITPDTPQFYQELMESCWNQDPKQRPTIQTI